MGWPPGTAAGSFSWQAQVTGEMGGGPKREVQAQAQGYRFMQLSLRRPTTPVSCASGWGPKTSSTGGADGDGAKGRSSNSKLLVHTVHWIQLNDSRGTLGQTR